MAPAGASGSAAGNAEQAHRCDEAVEAAVHRASEGDLEAAGKLLEDALRHCPEHVGVLRELAAVRFRENRRPEAELLARRLLAVEPNLVWGWDLLGTLRYLDDDAVAALRAWNRIDRPRLDEVDMLAPAGPALQAATGLRPGVVVTPEELARARRRLEAIPTVSRARVAYRPLAGGQVHVEAAVTRHSPHTLSRASVPAHLARALGGRVRIEASDRAGRGERLVLEGALDQEVREARVSLSHPGPWGTVPAAAWTLGHLVTDREGRQTERTGARAMVVPWPSARTHGTAGVGVDHWRDFGTHGVLEAAASLDLGRAVELHGGGSLWTGGFGVTEFAVATTLDRRTAPSAREEVGGGGPDRLGVGPALRTRTTFIALHGVSPGHAPDDLAPRFGGRRSSTHPMRAESTVLPPGDSWIHGTVEASRGWATPAGIIVGGALFADAVRGLGEAGPAGPTGAGGQAAATVRRGSVHLGTGLRVGIPGAEGWLRADWAVDPSSGRSRVSVAWVGQSR